MPGCVFKSQSVPIIIIIIIIIIYSSVLFQVTARDNVNAASGPTVPVSAAPVPAAPHGNAYMPSYMPTHGIVYATPRSPVPPPPPHALNGAGNNAYTPSVSTPSVSTLQGLVGVENTPSSTTVPGRGEKRAYEQYL